MPSQFLKSTPRVLSSCGPIAQLVEQLAFNQWVAGSSPARLKTFSKSSPRKTAQFSEKVEGQFLDRVRAFMPDDAIRSVTFSVTIKLFGCIIRPL
jgi:hypothetical protein